MHRLPSIGNIVSFSDADYSPYGGPNGLIQTEREREAMAAEEELQEKRGDVSMNTEKELRSKRRADGKREHKNHSAENDENHGISSKVFAKVLDVSHTISDT